MTTRIAIIQGHPDPQGHHFGHALAEAYARGAAEANHEVRTIDVATLEFPVLRTQQDFENDTPPDAIRHAQDVIGWADHLVIVFPLWLGTMPALLKAFLEQVLRPGFATSTMEPGKPWTKRLKGKSARVVVTMGMPALVYRWYYGAHGVKVLERNMLNFCGIRPVRRSLIGTAGGANAVRQKWLRTMHAFGREGR